MVIPGSNPGGPAISKFPWTKHPNQRSLRDTRDLFVNRRPNQDCDFIPRLDLCETFFRDAVKPILEDFYPDLVYSAALMGEGSDVLGFDTPQSMDHDWGPRLSVDQYIDSTDVLTDNDKYRRFRSMYQ